MADCLTMAAGIDDVARAAGVSTATVSRALRDLPNVSAKTRERVRAVATELGYVASPSAASLASGRTRAIGLISPWVNRWFFANIIDGAERALRARGYDVLLYTFDIQRSGERPRIDPDVLRRRVDGILVVGLPLARDELEALQGLGYPLVCIGWGGSEEATVRLDDRVIGLEAVRYLIRLGHRVIGHVTGTPDDVHPWSPPADRATGWREAMTEAGLEPDAGLMESGGFEVSGGRASVKALLARHPDLTAVFAASDEMAMGAILGLRDLGLRVPEDVSVMGVDGHELGELVGLTTMSQPVDEQGWAAAELVLDMINGKTPPRRVVFPARLVERTSTAAPRGVAS
ncbi:LacI family DNA-binding transcriptional regulator [Isoptericola sp. b441]|uniref:LacI family DNA-binding transcriptional regulator n=2 Tax=Actinotalea lenta TaxID=3064654 RepID=A0ABT9DAK3_9CELL|nr:LacI family DNA-binding transcriptional regulator [Isoptericola sp. b441]MDO8105972.1 LacI family DNA-binding transcriptional regulator [Isoptericola sp. b441]